MCTFIHPAGCNYICHKPIGTNTRCSFHNHVIFNPETWNLENLIHHGMNSATLVEIQQWIIDHPEQFKRKFHERLISLGHAGVVVLLTHPEKFNGYMTLPTTKFDEARFDRHIRILFGCMIGFLVFGILLGLFLAK